MPQKTLMAVSQLYNPLHHNYQNPKNLASILFSTLGACEVMFPFKISQLANITHLNQNFKLLTISISKGQYVNIHHDNFDETLK